MTVIVEEVGCRSDMATLEKKGPGDYADKKREQHLYLPKDMLGSSNIFVSSPPPWKNIA